MRPRRHYQCYILEKLSSSYIKYFSFTANQLLRIHSCGEHIKLKALIWAMSFCSLLKLQMLVDQVIVDRIDLNPRQFFTYNIINSCHYNRRLIFNINYALTSPLISLHKIFINSNWSEREMKEMFGCVYDFLPDERRLLTDYGFFGFCLRKDFPLSGYTEVRYDEELNSLTIEPVELSQDYRLFIAKSVWESNK